MPLLGFIVLCSTESKEEQEEGKVVLPLEDAKEVSDLCKEGVHTFIPIFD